MLLNTIMELGAHVWLRKEDSHWGWVPAVITKKETVNLSGLELINLTLNDDPDIERTMSVVPSSAEKKQRYKRSGSAYYAEQEKFQVVVTVDPEQLKTADHEDIKLRNLPNSFHLLQGDDSNAAAASGSPTT